MGNRVGGNGGILLSKDLGIIWVIQTNRTNQISEVQIGGGGLLVVKAGI